MDYIQRFKLLFFFNLIVTGNCQFADPQFDIMRYISNMVTRVFPNQSAIAYVKPIDENFPFNLTFPGFDQDVVKDYRQRYIAVRPNRGKHSEKQILNKLPEFIKGITGNKPFDLYLFTVNSPCCAPDYNKPVQGMNGYYSCSETSCSALISNFAIKHLGDKLNKNVPIRYMYVSWNQPFVSKNIYATPPADSVQYYQSYFYSIRQLLDAREKTKGRLVLLLEEPHSGRVQIKWFQKDLTFCLFQDLRLRNRDFGKRVYGFTNAITAKCVLVDQQDRNRIGAQNSFLNVKCWKRNWTKLAAVFKLPTNAIVWNELCLTRTTEMHQNNLIILGPPLNPEQGEAASTRQVTCQNLNCLELR